jgi:tetratricopeptide (TPR) repeat protein
MVYEIAEGSKTITTLAWFSGNNGKDSIGSIARWLPDKKEPRRLKHQWCVRYAYYNRGCMWIGQNRLEKGIADFTQAIRQDRNFAYTYYGRVCARYRTGEYAAAIADFPRQGITQCAEDPRALDDHFDATELRYLPVL